MATTVSLAQVDNAVANRAVTFQVTVNNTGSSSVSLTSLQIGESTESDCIISQPNFQLTNMPLGLGNPTITASGSVSYTFKVVFPSPNGAGPSPNAPGALGVTGMMNGQPADNNFTLLAQCQTSDGAVAASSLMVSVLSAISPFPRPEGGALLFTQASNTINGIITGVF